MSPFTKILIVLLSLFSIFLCGAVVSYVGSVNNYKGMFDDQKGLNNSLVSENTSLQRRFNEQTAQMKDLESKLNDRIQLLEDEKSKLDVELKNCQRLSLDYQSRVNSWAGVLTSFERTIANLEQSLALTQEQLSNAHAENIKDRKELNEITASLYEKIVQMQSLEADRRRLMEAKLNLEEQINQLLGPDSEAVSFEPVTPELDVAKPAAPVGAVSDLKGLITEVGKSLVSISLGRDDGVKKNMIFQVFRGDEFICQIIITNVDTTESAGVPELVQQQPRIGDYATTRL
ncbi:MAG TPA: hypothetical protein HPP87_02205 [Planctomycetes bacterium]|nr:hypothetical protein [Planctomycetota bacterium]